MKPNDLSDDERARVMAQVEHFIELLAHRYNITPDDVVETVKWVQRRRQFSEKLGVAGSAAIATLAISAIGAAVWEGVKTLLHMKGP